MRSFVLPIVLLSTGVAFAGTTATQVINFNAGAGSSRTDASAALGAPALSNAYGAVTPFNPAFDNSDIVTLGSGGSLTLKLGSPVAISGSAKLGVFDNTGVADESPATFDENFNYTSGGTGLAGSPPFAFGGGAGYVSVSNDGSTWYTKTASGWTLSTLATPESVTLSSITNAYADNTINLGQGSIGTIASDYLKPTAVTVNDLSGLPYSDSSGNDILHLLNGSAGGTWLDLSTVPTASVQYVKFDAPEGSRVVIDAVSAVPEPAVLGLIGLAATVLRRRRCN